MFTEKRRRTSPGDRRGRAKVEIARSRSTVLIAEIGVLLEHSHELIDRQVRLHRAWRH
jgi:hypothetical protein